MVSDAAARWFADNRGISKETLETFGAETVHFDVGPMAVTFPYPGGFKRVRYLDAVGDSRFRWLEPTPKGRIPGFQPPDFEQGKWMFLVEGETDCMAFWQNAPEEYRKGVVAVPGVPQFPRSVEELVKNAKKVFVIYDNDKAGYDETTGEVVLEKSASEAGWEKVRERLGRKARRVVLPPDVKDVAEFFQKYDWRAFSVLLRRAAEPVRHYPRLDLTKAAPPVKWLVEDLLVQQEVAVLAADGGMGKSWLCQALALAVAGTDNTFLGLPVRQHGRVLYIDEEASADLVLQRLNALGYDPTEHDQLEYIWYAGVDLLHEPEKLLEEACDIEPALIIIESLSRVALGGDENSNTEMTLLLRNGVVPLARESGAAVLVTHHTVREGVRIRGAGAIRNAADQTIVMKPAEVDGKETGTSMIFPDKPRREGASIAMQINGSMKAGEPVRVEPAPELPF